MKPPRHPTLPPPAVKDFIDAVLVPALLERLLREQSNKAA
jgi:hypothetical protein